MSSTPRLPADAPRLRRSLTLWDLILYGVIVIQPVAPMSVFGGLVICLLLWLSLSTPAKIAGTIWMAAGIAFGAWKTRGFRGDLVNFDLPAEEA